jgi:hypothetical protein
LIKLDAREENRNTWLRGGGGADPTCRSTLPAAKAGGSLSHALAVGLELVGYVWVNQSKRGKKKTKSSSRHTIYTCKLLLLVLDQIRIHTGREEKGCAGKAYLVGARRRRRTS